MFRGIRGIYMPERALIISMYKKIPLHERINAKSIARSLYPKGSHHYYYCTFMPDGEIFMSYIIDFATPEPPRGISQNER